MRHEWPSRKQTRTGEKGEFVRRTVLLLTTMSVALMLSAGMALAAAFSGSQGNDTLRGTPQADQIYGLSGNDTLYGFAGADELYGGAGSDDLIGSRGDDELYGGSGPDTLLGGPNTDFINSADRSVDVVNCGEDDTAFDEVVHDQADKLRECSGPEDVTTPVP